MPEFFSTRDIATRLGVSQTHVARLAAAGRIPTVRVGRLIKIPQAAWKAFLVRQTAAALAALTSPDSEEPANAR